MRISGVIDVFDHLEVFRLFDLPGLLLGLRRTEKGEAR